jgi:hypothetical protein
MPPAIQDANNEHIFRKDARKPSKSLKWSVKRFENLPKTCQEAAKTCQRKVGLKRRIAFHDNALP